MSDVKRFRSAQGATYPSPASGTWVVGLSLLLIGLVGGYKFTSLLIGLSGAASKSAILIVSLVSVMLLSVAMIWTGAASIIGAIRRSLGVTVTRDGISSTSIFGTQWAEWSSLGPFREGTFNAGRQGVMPCATAPVIGPNASKDLRRKQTFLIVDHFGIPADQFAAELNSAHGTGKVVRSDRFVAAASASATRSGRKFTVLTAVTIGFFVVMFGFQLYRLLTL